MMASTTSSHPAAFSASIWCTIIGRLAAHSREGWAVQRSLFGSRAKGVWMPALRQRGPGGRHAGGSRWRGCSPTLEGLASNTGRPWVRLLTKVDDGLGHGEGEGPQPGAIAAGRRVERKAGQPGSDGGKRRRHTSGGAGARARSRRRSAAIAAPLHPWPDGNGLGGAHPPTSTSAFGAGLLPSAMGAAPADFRCTSVSSVELLPSAVVRPWKIGAPASSCGHGSGCATSWRRSKETEVFDATQCRGNGSTGPVRRPPSPVAPPCMPRRRCDPLWRHLCWQALNAGTFERLKHTQSPMCAISHQCVQ